MGKRIENAFFPKSRANALIGSCDLFVELEHETIKDCIRKKPPSTNEGGKF
jgi:hypothetical protein